MKPNVRAQSEPQPNHLFAQSRESMYGYCNYSSMSEQRKPCKQGGVHTGSMKRRDHAVLADKAHSGHTLRNELKNKGIKGSHPS